jgi:hypothetical protein
MEGQPNAKPKRTPKRVLRLPDVDHSKRTVLDSLASPDSARAYAFAMNDFIAWYCSDSRAPQTESLAPGAGRSSEWTGQTLRYRAAVDRMKKFCFPAGPL